MKGSRSATSLQKIGLPGRLSLPSKLDPHSRAGHIGLLRHSVGFNPWITSWNLQPDFRSGSDTDPRYSWGRLALSNEVTPDGSSISRARMRSKCFAYAFARQTLAVALTNAELLSIGKGVFLRKTPQKVLLPSQELATLRCLGLRAEDPSLTWFLLGGGRLTIAFSRFLVSNWRRTLGLDPRSPFEQAKLPLATLVKQEGFPPAKLKGGTAPIKLEQPKSTTSSSTARPAPEAKPQKQGSEIPEWYSDSDAEDSDAITDAGGWRWTLSQRKI